MTTSASKLPRVVIWTLACTLALLVIPAAIDLAAGGLRRVFDYLACDSYYYLTVARNVVDKGRVSFDGQLGTNGFHPCWQYLLVVLFAVGRVLHLGETTLMGLVVAVNLALIAGGIYFLGRGLAAATGRLTPLFVSLPVGAYGLFVLPIWLKEPGLAQKEVPVLGPLWSYVNGMESGTLYLFYGLTVWWFLTRPVARERRAAIVFGVLLAMLTFSRLDHVFIPLALGGLALGGALTRRDWSAARHFLVAAAVAGALLALYCAANWLWIGAAFPVSGALKSSFPRVNHANLERLWACLFHAPKQTWSRLFRVAELFIPLVAAAVCVVAEVRVRLRPLGVELRAGAVGLVLVATAIGVACVSLYDLAYVELADQGPWYTPIGTLFTSLYVALLLDRIPPLHRLLSRPLAAYVTLAVGVALGTIYFLRYEQALNVNRRWADFYLLEAPRVKAFYAGKDPKFLEVDDGIFTFATGFPAMAGKGFVLDVEAVRALRQNTIVPLSVARGFDRITSVLYMNAGGLSSTSPSDVVCPFVSGVTPARQCQQYRFVAEYVHGNFGIIRVLPKENP